MEPPEWTAAGPTEAIETALAVSRHGSRALLYQTGRRIFWGAVPFILACAALPGWPVPWSLFANLALALCALLMVAGAVTGMTPAPSRVLATLDGRGLRFDTPTTVVALAREALRDGMVIAPGGRFALRLHDRAGDRFELAMPDELTAWRWLHALDLSADRRAVRVINDRTLLQAVSGYFLSSFTAMPMLFAWMAILAAIGNGEAGGAAMFLATIHSVMFGMWGMSLLVGHVDVTVGGDGLVVRGTRRQYVPFEALDEVTRDGARVALRLRTQWRPLSLHFASDVDAAAVAVRIAAARAAWHASAPPACLARLKVSNPADAEAWRVAFREALGDGSYRDAALTFPDLEAVVTSVAVTHPQRTGAALALRDLQPAMERTGVRVATELLVGDDALESIARADADHPEGARMSRGK